VLSRSLPWANIDRAKLEERGETANRLLAARPAERMGYLINFYFAKNIR
jgi:hypothetical protein